MNEECIPCQDSESTPPRYCPTCYANVEKVRALTAQTEKMSDRIVSLEEQLQAFREGKFKL